MLRVISANLNGIRSAARKGFFDWMLKQDADVICIQETKAHAVQLTDPVFHPEGYHVQFVDAEKKGYSGVAIYSKEKPLNVITTLGMAEADAEGRYLQFDFEKYSVASLYLPSGTSGEERQSFKYKVLGFYEESLKEQRLADNPLIICGDWNIAHKQIDIKNWRPNQKNSGFLPEERAWMDQLFDEIGYVDAFRVVNEEAEQYTWWSNRGQAWANNVGWRIDYQVISPELKKTVKSASIYRDEKFSDHAPLTMDYDIAG